MPPAASKIWRKYNSGRLDQLLYQQKTTPKFIEYGTPPYNDITRDCLKPKTQHPTRRAVLRCQGTLTVHGDGVLTAEVAIKQVQRAGKLRDVSVM